MDRHAPPKPNAQILEEASTWFVELSEGEVSLSAREQFTAWLQASPEHVRAYLQISSVWEDAPLLGKRDSPGIPALLAAARSAGNIVSLGATAAAQSPPAAKIRAARGGARGFRWAVAAGVLAAALGAAFWLQWQRGVYSTGIGETRWVTLADGSVIELNAASRIRVRLTRAARVVDLLRGQALFQVTQDPARPFVVQSGPAQITDVGTEFDVYRRRDDTVVTVIEGRIAVRTAAAASSIDSLLPGGPEPTDRAPPTRLDAHDLGTLITAGEQVDLTPRAPPRPRHVDIAAATAWTRQTLVFAATPLTEVVAQYNLYHEKPLVIRDPSLANYHVSGMFSVTDSSALVAFLRAQPTLALRETGNEIDISSR